MKPGELKPLTKEQKEGIKKSDELRASIVKAVEEKYSKYPASKSK